MNAHTVVDSLSLKYATPKAWSIHSKNVLELLRRYFEIGASTSAMLQHDTPEQKRLLCQIIDGLNCETVYLDWNGALVSKDEAKRYVMEYGKDAKA